MLKFLSDNGLTPVVLVGFVMTIVSSFLSARWGGAESRRQYRDTAQTDRRSAAAEMIPLLIEFADECDRRKGSLSTYMSSEGQDGEDETMSGMTLSPAIRNCASRLGGAVAERAIKFEVMKARAEAHVAGSSGYIANDRGTINGRVAAERRPIHIPDVLIVPLPDSCTAANSTVVRPLVGPLDEQPAIPTASMAASSRAISPEARLCAGRQQSAHRRRGGGTAVSAVHPP
jgi:hypothetical protein